MLRLLAFFALSLFALFLLILRMSVLMPVSAMVITDGDQLDIDSSASTVFRRLTFGL